MEFDFYVHETYLGQPIVGTNHFDIALKVARDWDGDVVISDWHCCIPSDQSAAVEKTECPSFGGGVDVWYKLR